MCQWDLHTVLWLHINIYTYGPPSCRNSQYCRTLIPLSASLWNELADSVFDGVGLVGLKRGPMFFWWPKLLYLFLSSIIFPCLFFLAKGWYYVAGDFGLIGCRSLSPSLALLASFNNNYKKKKYKNMLQSHTCSCLRGNAHLKLVFAVISRVATDAVLGT